MPSSLYFPPSPRNNGLRQKGRNGNLPSFFYGADEKLHQHAHLLPWTITLSIPIPGIQNRRLRLTVPHLGRIHQFTMARFGRKRGSLILCFALFALVFTVFALAKRFVTPNKKWPTLSPAEPPTLVFRRDDLQRIWNWEVASGHYPSRQASEYWYSTFVLGAEQRHDVVPEQIGLTMSPTNPVIPKGKPPTIPSRFKKPPGPFKTDTIGVGPKRVYLDLQSQPPNIAYPPRPVPGSIADLDIIMDHCDFSQQKVCRPRYFDVDLSNVPVVCTGLLRSSSRRRRFR
jgi:DDB1- and CUL4-associated factor 13